MYIYSSQFLAHLNNTGTLVAEKIVLNRLCRIHNTTVSLCLRVFDLWVL
jgi:hypothetical protein